MSEAVNTGAKAAHGVAFPPFHAETFASQLFWLAVTFAFLYWFVSKVALPRISAVIDERKQRIDTDIGEANQLKAKADAALHAYESELAAAKANARDIAEGTRARLAGESDARRRVLEEELSSKIAAAEKAIEETKAQAMVHVSEIASDTASAIVERLLGNAPEPDVLKTAVKSALAGQ